MILITPLTSLSAALWEHQLETQNAKMIIFL